MTLREPRHELRFCLTGSPPVMRDNVCVTCDAGSRAHSGAAAACKDFSSRNASSSDLRMQSICKPRIGRLNVRAASGVHLRSNPTARSSGCSTGWASIGANRQHGHGRTAIRLGKATGAPGCKSTGPSGKRARKASAAHSSAPRAEADYRAGSHCGPDAGRT